VITLQLVGDREVIAKLSAMPEGMRAGLARAITRLSLEGERLSKQKLSGEVLNVRTGALRSGVHALPTTASTTEIKGGWGSSVFYGRFHEYGVAHSWQIRPKTAKALAFEIGGRTIFAMHVTHPPLPERSFMRSALREMQYRIQSEIGAAVSQELHR
jgi:hypothetical protein